MKKLHEEILSEGIMLDDQRKAILEHLFNSRQHPTAEEIHQDVSRSFSEIGVETVTHFLRELAKSGFIKELQIEPGHTRFDRSPKSHHHHFYCRVCKEVTDHTRISSLFENMNVEAMDGVENSVYGVSMILKGTCDKCMSSRVQAACEG